MAIIETPEDPESKAPVLQMLDPKLHRVIMIIGIMLIIGGLFLALRIMWPFIDMIIRTLLPFAVGLLLAYLLNPIVSFVQVRLRLTRVGGVIILHVLAIALVLAFFSMVLPVLALQIQNAYHELIRFFTVQLGRNEELMAMVMSVDAWLIERGFDIRGLFQSAVQAERIQEAAGTAASSGARFIFDVFAYMVDFIRLMFGFAIFIVFALLVNIYLLIDFSKIQGLLEVVIPPQHQDRIFDMMGKADVAVGGFIRGIILCAASVGLMTFIALYLLGLREYALLIAIIAGIFNLIPYLGPIAGGAPAILYVLLSSDFGTVEDRLLRAGGILLALGIIQFIDGFILQPKIIGQNASLHPVTILVALAVGANWGLLGMLVAVPLACVLRVLVKEFFWDRRERSWRERTGLDSFDYYDPRRRTKRVKKQDLKI